MHIRQDADRRDSEIGHPWLFPFMVGIQREEESEEPHIPSLLPQLTRWVARRGSRPEDEGWMKVA